MQKAISNGMPALASGDFPHVSSGDLSACCSCLPHIGCSCLPHLGAQRLEVVLRFQITVCAECRDVLDRYRRAPPAPHPRPTHPCAASVSETFSLLCFAFYHQGGR